MRFGLLAAALGYLFSMAVLIKLAITYVELGYGLTPWVALPLSLAAAVGGVLSAYQASLNHKEQPCPPRNSPCP